MLCPTCSACFIEKYVIYDKDKLNSVYYLASCWAFIVIR